MKHFLRILAAAAVAHSAVGLGAADALAQGAVNIFPNVPPNGSPNGPANAPPNGFANVPPNAYPNVPPGTPGGVRPQIQPSKPKVDDAGNLDLGFTVTGEGPSTAGSVRARAKALAVYACYDETDGFYGFGNPAPFGGPGPFSGAAPFGGPNPLLGLGFDPSFPQGAPVFRVRDVAMESASFSAGSPCELSLAAPAPLLDVCPNQLAPTLVMVSYRDLEIVDGAGMMIVPPGADFAGHPNEAFLDTYGRSYDHFLEESYGGGPGGQLGYGGPLGYGSPWGYGSPVGYGGYSGYDGYRDGWDQGSSGNYPGYWGGSGNYPGYWGGSGSYPGYGGDSYPGYGGDSYPGYGGDSYPGYGGDSYPGYGGGSYPGYGYPGGYTGYGGGGYPGYGYPGGYTGYGGGGYPGYGYPGGNWQYPGSNWADNAPPGTYGGGNAPGGGGNKFKDYGDYSGWNDFNR